MVHPPRDGIPRQGQRIRKGSQTGDYGRPHRLEHPRKFHFQHRLPVSLHLYLLSLFNPLCGHFIPLSHLFYFLFLSTSPSRCVFNDSQTDNELKWQNFLKAYLENSKSIYAIVETSVPTTYFNTVMETYVPTTVIELLSFTTGLETWCTLHLPSWLAWIFQFIYSFIFMFSAASSLRGVICGTSLLSYLPILTIHKNYLHFCGEPSFSFPHDHKTAGTFKYLLFVSCPPDNIVDAIYAYIKRDFNSRRRPEDSKLTWYPIQ